MENINNDPRSQKDPDDAIERIKKISGIADNIEQLFYDQGEYKKYNSERLRWFKDIPSPDELKSDPREMVAARLKVRSEIYQSLKSGVGAPKLQEYMVIQASFKQHSMFTGEISKTDYNKYTKLYLDIKSVLTPELLASNAEHFKNMSIEDQNKLTIKDYDTIRQNMDILPVNDYLFNEYGYESYDISVLKDQEITNGVSCEYKLLPGQSVYKDELDQIYAELKEQARELVQQHEPMVAVSFDSVAPLPYLVNKETGKIYTVNELRDKISDLANGRVVTILGDPDSKDNNVPEFDDRPVKLDVTLDYETIRDSINRSFDAHIQEREKYSAILDKVIDSAGYSLDKNYFGHGLRLKIKDTIYHLDKSNDEPLAFSNAQELIEFMDNHFTHISNALADEAKEIVAKSEYAKSVPETYADWKFFVSDFNMNDENVKIFADTHREELDIMKLANNPRLADLRLTFKKQNDQNEKIKEQIKDKNTEPKKNKNTGYPLPN